MASKNTGVLHYSIGKIGLQIRYSPKSIARDINNLFTRYNFIYPASHIKPGITLSLHIVSHPSFRVLKKAKLILRFYSWDFKVYKKGNYLFLTDNSNFLILQPERGKGILLVKRQNKLDLISALDRFFLPAIIILLRSRNLFYLHAAGVIKNGHKILFVSEGGKGKSTSALTLFLKDWKYLSDDAVFLKHNNKRRVTALSLTSELRLKKQNPILDKNEFYFSQRLRKRNNGQESFYQVNIASIAPNRIIESFIPNLIFFCTLSRSKFSALEPVKKSEAILYLINQSKSIFLGGRAAINNGAILADLVNQAENYKLKIGKDIRDSRLSLCDLISLRLSQA